MLRIDAHQHFWKFDPLRDGWITENMSVIRKDFLPGDLKPILEKNGFDGCVTVQSDQSEIENDFQLRNALHNDFIKGIVGWVDLTSPAIEERLADLSQHKKLKGFRHVLQGEKDRAYMLQPSFMSGIRQLKKHNFTYDILIHPDQLKHILDFVQAFPDQPFVIDHLAKPDIKNKEIEDWQKGLKKIAKHQNVFCKVSGMVTEADWRAWKQEDFVPYLDVVIEAFGTHRILYGSDWPVCLVAGSYEKVLDIVTTYFSYFSKSEQDLFFGGNAIKFYNLNI